MTAKAHPDTNDTMRQEGPDALRARHDRSRKYQSGNGQNTEGGIVGPRIKLIAFDEIKLTTERRYLVKGLVPRVGLCVAWGPPKCGKSFWAFDLAMHVALGLGISRSARSSWSVVYCAFEGAQGFAARIVAFRQRFLARRRGPGAVLS